MEEFGPIELEVIFFIIFMVSGCYGVGAMDRPIGPDLGGIFEANLPTFICWGFLITSIFWFLIISTAIDNITAGFKKNSTATMYYLNPIWIIIATAFAEAHMETECYKN